MSERCDRCKSTGADRRTLWMACFYAMDELGLPFGNANLWTVSEDTITATTEKIPYSTRGYRNGEPFEESGTVDRNIYRANGEASRRDFFTLRVCKRCRAEWMNAIAVWFRTPPNGEDHDADTPAESIGSGIFVRENGSIREITREEWDRRVFSRRSVVGGGGGALPVVLGPGSEGEI